MPGAPIPLRLDLQKDRQLVIDWQSGSRSVYPIAYLRSMCPCAMCKELRNEQAAAKKPMLRVLSGNFNSPLAATSAELVGNYAIRLDWSDNHGSGIYSFEYLRSIDPALNTQSPQGD